MRDTFFYLELCTRILSGPVPVRSRIGTIVIIIHRTCTVNLMQACARRVYDRSVRIYDRDDVITYLIYVNRRDVFEIHRPVAVGVLVFIIVVVIQFFIAVTAILKSVDTDRRSCFSQCLYIHDRKTSCESVVADAL